MNRFISLRLRLAGTVLVSLALALGAAFVLHRLLVEYAHRRLPWPWLFVCVIAFACTWFLAERFVLKRIGILTNYARQLAAGDLSNRSGLAEEGSEFGDLARTFDEVVTGMQQRLKSGDLAEKSLFTKAMQQTVVSALGQFALVSKDLESLLVQAATMITQTLELEYSSVLEYDPVTRLLRLSAGFGWPEGVVGNVIVSAEAGSEGAYALAAGDPVRIADIAAETRFTPAPYLLEHGIVSGMIVAIAGQGRSFGTLGAYTTRPRTFSEDEVHFLMAVATVLGMAVARKEMELEREKIVAFAQLNPYAAMELNLKGRINYFNNAALTLARSCGQSEPAGLLPKDLEAIIEQCVISGSSLQDLEHKIGDRTLSLSFHPVLGGTLIHAYVQDISARLSLEAQLRQSQKMESVGQLAAGVAHDFNNMLTIIQGHSGLLLSRAALQPGQRESLQAIMFATERAASLTRQLLMFSRKSVMQPRNLDLREIISNLNKMLQRLLGEPIRLKFDPPPELPLIYGDAGMLEQVLMNLAVNARDAMPEGGELLISTEVTRIDEQYVHSHSEARTGKFVCLRVRDTGCGMDAGTMTRIFEPFFTTKEVGKGTGLGLATVYGIVRQHEGWIEVASQPGAGSTFSIFLPAMDGGSRVGAGSDKPAPAYMLRGNETILLVEDEPILRDMARALLEDSGYRVFAAASGREALARWQELGSEVDLLLTDVVMPEGMSGLELAQTLTRVKPGLKVVFVSGYPVEELDSPMLKQTGAILLQKPYTQATLGKTLRQCLDGK